MSIFQKSVINSIKQDEKLDCMIYKLYDLTKDEIERMFN
ncbi:hypothetical protein AF75_07620 [Aliarcobacter butzleri L350]|uniref:Uncharacterized protein n=1 Tax=Aliarcobacter butzleri L351 TaxID=1447259 RepID=A0A837J566_9BACT|nr:hypothetical protein AF76_07535 [Aliarcobacter butzleri L351]KLE12760.1 hypothetical protein AF75_07620 [Aliarcobacter butzleri L350]